MSKATLTQVLDRLVGSAEGDLDASLLRRFLARRDEAAFAALVHRHGPLVYGTCRRILGNRDDTDDAFQAVFFVLARRAPGLDLGRGIGPWLHGVALRVARKLRGQLVRRRLREMAAARPERVDAAAPADDCRAVIDEEVAHLPLPLREVVLLCDLGGRSHAQAAASLGLAKGTVTKRLAKARAELATRLTRRGVTLGAGTLAAGVAAQADVSVPAPLIVETAKQSVAFAARRGGGTLAARALAEGILRSLRFGALRAWLAVGLLGLTLAGGLMLAGGPGETLPGPPDKPEARPGPARPATMWKEGYTVEFPGALPVSVAFSADGQTLLTGDTGGEVTAFLFTRDDLRWRWKRKVGGAHAAVAYSADQKVVYATTEDGVRVLDAARGEEQALIEAKGSNPTALGVFPKRTVAGAFTQLRIVFGNARGYFIESWAEGRNLADTIGTIETSTVPAGAMPADVAAVPLAVDPQGRCAIMTGPRDPTGRVTGVKGMNVLWAYACGDHGDGSPGNRMMVGHAATVVAAAWAKEGARALTGDAAGRVILWDARTMKETGRVEVGGRVLALAVSGDGKRSAAFVRGKRGGDLYVWETARPAAAGPPIHAQPGDLGSEPYASLAFAPDGQRLAGCVIDKRWLRLPPATLPAGTVRVWELAPEPKAQPAPRHLYTKRLPRGASPDFVILHDQTLLMAAPKPGAVDFRSLRDGEIQARLVLGKFAIGRMKLAADHKWLALEQRPPANDARGGAPAGTFQVGVYEWTLRPKATIPSCSRLLDIASGGKVVAVERDGKIELWDVATAKLVKAAPFGHRRIDTACFSPDGNVLAVSDRDGLVLWKWEAGTHERIDLGRRVGSLAFAPDGRWLAEGPAPGESIRIRDVESRNVVRAVGDGARRVMSVPAMAYTQGGRVLITCDNGTDANGAAVRQRIHLWDTASGSVAHRIAVPAGVPHAIDVSPNGRYLAATLDDGTAGTRLSVWRLDGATPEREPGSPPASAGRR